jgi:hypothetical protein
LEQPDLKGYRLGATLTLGMIGSASIHFNTNADFQAENFFDSMRSMGTIEDPNEDYPSGHYLPFPTLGHHHQ